MVTERHPPSDAISFGIFRRYIARRHDLFADGQCLDLSARNTQKKAVEICLSRAECVVSSRGIRTSDPLERYLRRFLKAAKKGETLVIDAETVKLGRTLAFLSVEFRNKQNNELLATGKHTKYLS